MGNGYSRILLGGMVECTSEATVHNAVRNVVARVWYDKGRECHATLKILLKTEAGNPSEANKPPSGSSKGRFRSNAPDSRAAFTPF